MSKDNSEKKYLYSCPHNWHNPKSHGLVEIDDNGYVNGETPIEDYGMYFYGDKEFLGDVGQAFIDLMGDQGPDFSQTEIYKYLWE